MRSHSEHAVPAKGKEQAPRRELPSGAAGAGSTGSLAALAAAPQQR